MSSHNKMAVYIPPPNFGFVEKNLYRSGAPSDLNLPFMERLGLRTIVYLAPDTPSLSFLNFMEEQEIRFVHLGRHAGSNSTPGGSGAWQLISEAIVLDALQLVLDDSNYPVHIMCHLGRHRTGTVVGCLRKVQRWNLASIFSEYRRHAGNKARHLNDQFIELFDTDLVHMPARDSNIAKQLSLMYP